MADNPLIPDANAFPRESAQPVGEPRLLGPVRDQLLLVPSHLEELLAPDHRARAVWEFVKGLDLEAFYARIRSVEGHGGRPAIDPAILMALWLYATVEGVGSARALERLCEAHDAYRWICGGVSVNHHTLSDFKGDHPDLLDPLLTQSVGALMAEGMVTLERVAQDGVRVRASAGASSFRRKESLEGCLKEAEEQVAALRRELHDDPQATTRRQAAAKQRAARDRVERVGRALKQQEAAAAKKKTQKEKDATRASTTDPEARVMKMADGGFREAYNAQFSTDTASQVIVGVGVGNVGSDLGQLPPMMEQVETRLGKRPTSMLVDGGFVRHEDIESEAAKGSAVYAPVLKKRKDPTWDPHAARPGESEALTRWRGRMGTPEAKEIYKERASTAECVNALARMRGLRQFLVRGMEKVRAVLLWFALAHNMMRARSLRARAVRAT